MGWVKEGYIWEEGLVHKHTEVGFLVNYGYGLCKVSCDDIV